jgi:hypothetical protein
LFFVYIYWIIKKQIIFMKLKKFFTIFCSSFLLTLALLPDIAMAGSYTVNLYSDTFPSPKGNGKFDAEKETIGNTIPVYYEGFVPCGVELCKSEWKEGSCAGGEIARENNSCQLCHVFVMANNLVSFLVIKVVPILAALMLVVGGIMLFFAGTNPSLLGRSKTLIKGVAIGLLLVYGSYILVNTFLWVLGAADVNSVSQIYKDGVFSIKCPVYIIQ